MHKCYYIFLFVKCLVLLCSLEFFMNLDIIMHMFSFILLLFSFQETKLLNRLLTLLIVVCVIIDVLFSQFDICMIQIKIMRHYFSDLNLVKFVNRIHWLIWLNFSTGNLRIVFFIIFKYQSKEIQIKPLRHKIANWV